MDNFDFRSKEFDKKQDVIFEKDFIFSQFDMSHFYTKIIWACFLCLNIVGSGADTGGGGGRHSPP